MNKFFKKVIIIFIALWVVGGGIFIYIKSNQFNQQLKKTITEQLTSYTDKQVVIERIHTDILNRIVLTNISLNDKETGQQQLSVKRARISYSLIKFFKNVRNISELVKEIRLYQPRLTLKYSDSKFFVEGLETLMSNSTGGPPLPPWNIRFSDGEFRFKLEDNMFQNYSDLEIRNFRGQFSLASYPRLTGDTQFSISRTGYEEFLIKNLGVDLDYNIVSKNFESRLNIKDAMLDSLSEFNFLDQPVKFSRGSLKGNIKLGGNIDKIKENIENITGSGQFVVRDAKFDNLSIKKAQLNISPDRILVDRGLLAWRNSNFSLSGKISSYLKEPYFDVTAFGNIGISEVVPAGLAQNAKGTVDFEGEITGEPKDIKISGGLNMARGKLAGIDIKNLKTSVSYYSQKLNFKTGNLEFGGGNLNWDGYVGYPGEDLDVNIRLENLDLNDIAGKESISGYAGGNIDLSRDDLKSLQVLGNLNIHKFNIGRKNLGIMNTSFNYSDENFIASGFTMDDKYHFNTRIKLKEKSKSGKIEQFSFLFPEGGQLNCKGYFNYSPLKAQLKIDGVGIPINEIPQLTEKYDSITGILNFDGTLESRADKTFLKGNLNTENAGLDQYNYEVKTDVVYESGRVSENLNLLNLELNRSLFGRLKLNINNSKYRIKDLKFRAEELNLPPVQYLISPGPGINNGILNGQFNYDSEFGRSVFNVRELNIEEIFVGDIHGVMKYDAEKWYLEELDVSGDQGKINIDGELYPDQELEIVMDSYNLNHKILDGWGKFYGKYKDKEGYIFETEFENMNISGHDWPASKINGVYFQDKWNLTLNIRELIKGNLNIEPDKNYELSGELQLFDFNLQKLHPFFETGRSRSGLVHDITGAAKGIFKIEDSYSNPLLTYDGDINKGYLRDTPFDLKGKVVYKPGKIITVIDAAGAIGDGRISIDGSLEHAQKSELKIEVRNFSTDFIESTLKNDQLNLSMDGDFRLTGTLDRYLVKMEILSRQLNFDSLDLRRAQMAAVLEDNNLNISRAELFKPDGSFVLTDTDVLIKGDNNFKFKGKGKFENFIVAPVTFLGETGVEGDFGLSPFFIDLKLNPENLFLNRLKLENKLNMDYRDKKLKLNVNNILKSEVKFLSEGRITVEQLKYRDGNKSFTGEGKYTPGEADFNLSANNVEINKFIKALDKPVEFYGRSNFEIDIYYREEDSFNISGDLLVNRGRYRKIPIERVQSHFNYRDGILDLKDTKIKDSDYLNVAVKGTLGEAQPGLEVDVKRLSLSSLQLLTEEIKDSSGYFSGQFKIIGTLNNPRFSGQLDLANGRIKGREIIGDINKINSRITARETRLNIDHINAQWSPGRIEGSGYIDIDPGFSEIEFSLKTVGDKGVLVKIPYLNIPQSGLFGRYLSLPSYGEPGFEINITTEEDLYRISGDINLAETHFTYPPVATSPSPPALEVWDIILLDINLNAGKSVWYENTYARLKVDGGLNFKKIPEQDLMVNGTVSSSQGRVSYLNREFEVEEVTLIFSDSVEQLSGRATTQVQRRTEGGTWTTEDISLIIPRDRVGNISPRFVSDEIGEDLTSEKTAEIAIAGTDFSNLSRDDRNMLLRRELLRAIDANLTSPLVKNILQRTTIIDDAKVDVLVDSSEDEETMRLTGAGLRVGSNLTDRFSMGYYMEVGPGYENKLRLNHEFDMLYRLQDSQFFRGRISEERDIYFGIEQQLKF